MATNINDSNECNIIYECDEYWIVEKHIILKPNFEQNEMDIEHILFNAIEQHKFTNIIFSNYIVPIHALKHNHYYYVSEIAYWIESLFNKPLDIKNLEISQIELGYYFDSVIILPDTLKKIIFGASFNKCVEFPPSVEYIQFGYCFDQELHFTHLPLLQMQTLIFDYRFNQNISLETMPNLTKLVFGKNFNQNIAFFPPNLKYLSLGFEFNQMIEIPLSITHLSLDCPYCEIGGLLIDRLPNGIEELTLKLNMADTLIFNLPTGIKKLIFGSEYNCELNCLPNTIEYIALAETYELEIKSKPANLKTIKCSKNYKFLDDFSNYNVEFYD